MASKNEQEFEDLPAPLIAEFKRAELSVSLITPRVDRQISELSKAQFSNRRQPIWRSRPGWAAIAATVLITLFVIESQLPPGLDQSAIYADIDNSGQVDIADVLALARDSGEISQAEIDAFATQIVSLSPVDDAS